MTAVQLPLAARPLPLAFTERWRELGGPSIEGELLATERGRHTFTVHVGACKFAFVRRSDVGACADELFRSIQQ